MKWTSLTVDLSKIRKWLQSLRTMARLFVVMTSATLMFFVGAFLVGFAQSQAGAKPAASMKDLAAQVSDEFFLELIGLEVPHFHNDDAPSALTQKSVFGFLFRLLTDINPGDPKTLLARELPGLGDDDAVLLRKGKGTDVAEAPVDYWGGGAAAKPSATPNATPSASPGATQAQAAASPSASPTPASATSAGKPTTSGRNVVMFYHSHNRESWVPELGIKDPSLAYDDKKNITLVGKRMAEKLNALGIGAVDYSPDYASTEKDYNFAYSYKYSQKTVKEAFAANPDLTYLFDIHRDSSTRDKTTITIDGKDYAQIYFIIGQKNPNWKKNEQFATKVSELLEAKKPGISRGIWAKSLHDGNAEYNQSMSPNNILIEIGGPYNTLEECNRTADLLADVIADIYWDAEKVNARG